jgi:geranylgeranyl diphosphate synthase type I
MSSSSSLQAITAQYLPAVEAELRDLLASAGPPFGAYYQMLHYHMGWLDADLNPAPGQSGKRLRPVMCLLACEAAGSSPDPCLPAAAGIEALHNFSLLHDDIEDRSETRRGRPTVWRLWGVPQAINAGDGLFALAHLAFARLPDRGVPLQRALQAQRLLSQTCLALTHGQHLDMLFEERLDITVAEYLTMIQGKTAALFATSLQLGALLGGADLESAQRYWEFGHHLGISFQIQDDLLGIWGDNSVTGKSTSTDIETRKKTLPVVYGLERSKELRDLYSGAAIQPAQVGYVARSLEALGAREMAETLSAEHHARALEALESAAAAGEGGQALQALAQELLGRAR